LSQGILVKPGAESTGEGAAMPQLGSARSNCSQFVLSALPTGPPKTEPWLPQTPKAELEIQSYQFSITPESEVLPG
jgi:hypothetical protein